MSTGGFNKTNPKSRKSIRSATLSFTKVETIAFLIDFGFNKQRKGTIFINFSDKQFYDHDSSCDSPHSYFI